MVNQSKVNDTRFRDLWLNSGAVGTIDGRVYATFQQFYNVLRGTDNINTAEIRGDYPARHNYMRQLLEKTGLVGTIILSAPDSVQSGARTNNGNIKIEGMGHQYEDRRFTETDNNKPYDQQPETNSIAQFIISPSFSVSREVREYKPKE